MKRMLPVEALARDERFERIRIEDDKIGAFAWRHQARIEMRDVCGIARRRDDGFGRRQAHCDHTLQIQLIEISDEESSLAGVGSAHDAHACRSQFHRVVSL